MASVEEVFRSLTGLLTGSGITAAAFTTVADADLEPTLLAMNAHLRAVEACVALGAAALAKRSDPALGQDGLAWQRGHASVEAMLQKLSGSSKAAARRQVAVGTMMAEAEAAHDLDAQSLERPGDEALARLAEAARPWHAALGDAVTARLLGAETAAGIRYGLGNPADGVSEDMLAGALATLIEECATLNADQARKAALRMRDAIDSAGIAAREEAKQSRQYWKQWVKPDGMVHGEYELDPENGAFVKDVYDQLTAPRRGGPRFIDPAKKAWAAGVAADPRSTQRIAVDGLVELLRIGTAADPGTVYGGNRPAVKILVTRNSLRSHTTASASTSSDMGTSPGSDTRGIGFGAIEGNPALVSLETVDRHLCTDGYTPVAFDDDGQCVNVGRTQRLFTNRQRDGLASRDGGCMWPNCDRPPSWTEAHHINEWKADHGNTDLKDGILLCKRDHLRLHNQGWKIQRRNENEYCLTPPVSIDPKQTPIRLRSKSTLNPDPAAEPPMQENTA